MQNGELTNNTTPKTGIEFTVMDNNKSIRKVLMILDTNDKWFTSINPTDLDVLGMFGGALIELFKKDPSTDWVQAQSFKIENSVVKKSISFTAQGKINGVFKDCILNNDGTFQAI